MKACVSFSRLQLDKQRCLNFIVSCIEKILNQNLIVWQIVRFDFWIYKNVNSDLCLLFFKVLFMCICILYCAAM